MADVARAGDAALQHLKHRAHRRKGRGGQERACAAQLGARGTTRSVIAASAGVRSALRWLQPAQEATVFVQVLAPPRERGRMWSMVAAAAPQ